MALTRQYRETVLERIGQDADFTAALYAEAISAIIEGDKETALSILRDLVHAHISFKKLAKQTGFDEKALHRMLGKNGNPRMDNLLKVIHTVESDLHLQTRIETGYARKPAKRRPSVAVP